MEAGPEHLDSSPSGPTGRSRLIVVLAALVAVVLALVVLDQRRLDQSVPTPTPTPGSGPSVVRGAPNPVPTRVRPDRSSLPVTTRGSGPLAPGVPAGVLYARSSEVVYRIDTRTGTVVATGGAVLASGGPVTLVPTGRGLLVRPYDSVPGLRVHDGQRAVPLTGVLAGVHEVFPGPPGRIWAVEAEY